jgi:hypothetical protein
MLADQMAQLKRLMFCQWLCRKSVVRRRFGASVENAAPAERQGRRYDRRACRRRCWRVAGLARRRTATVTAAIAPTRRAAAVS